MKKNQVYATPSVVSFDVAQEVVVCASEVKGHTTITDWENGGGTEDDLYL